MKRRLCAIPLRIYGCHEEKLGFAGATAGWMQPVSGFTAVALRCPAVYRATDPQISDGSPVGSTRIIRNLSEWRRGAGYEAPHLTPSPARGCHGNDPASGSGSRWKLSDK
ncbi:hypothetical protein F2P79_020948 [Pimephales promelas]|nr:hypothetical protein F2P79_020948 [Pimephales promelas]